MVNLWCFWNIRVDFEKLFVPETTSWGYRLEITSKPLVCWAFSGECQVWHLRCTRAWGLSRGRGCQLPLSTLYSSLLFSSPHSHPILLLAFYCKAFSLPICILSLRGSILTPALCWTPVTKIQRGPSYEFSSTTGRLYRGGVKNGGQRSRSGVSPTCLALSRCLGFEEEATIN